MRRVPPLTGVLALPPAFTRIAAVFVVLSLVVGAAVFAADELPYLGNWSNGRGETLVITAKTIRVREGRALPYRDVTRATAGSSFELQISARGAANGFGGSTLSVECEGDAMTIKAFTSHGAYMEDRDPQSIVTWYKDDDEAEADE